MSTVVRGGSFIMRWLLLLAMLVVQVSYAEQKLRISTLDGIAAAPHISEFIRAAYQKIGYEIEIVPMPAKRSLYQAREREDIDAELARTINAAGYLPKHTLIPVPVAYVKVAAFVNNPKLSFSRWSDLNNYKVAAVRGHLAAEGRLAERSDVYFLNDAEQVLTMLERGRVDVAILPKGIGLYVIKKHRHRQLTTPPMVIDEIPIYHFLHSRHHDLVEPLTQAMRQLRQQADQHLQLHKADKQSTAE